MCGVGREVCRVLISPGIPLAEAYILSEMPHLPWERPRPLSGAGSGGNSRKLPSALSSPSEEVSQAIVGNCGIANFASTLSAHRGLQVTPGGQALGECNERDSLHSKMGAKGEGVMDPGEAKRSPEPGGQCLSNTVWGRGPESANAPGTRPHALVWPGKVIGPHHGQDVVALRLCTHPTLIASDV